MKKKLFVALSACNAHKLTEEQIADFDGEIILLSTVSPELAQECSNIDPNCSISHIQHLAAQVVVLAVLAESTHFCCQGEPGLQLWANLMAHGIVEYVDGDIHTTCSIVEKNQGWEVIQMKDLDPVYPYPSMKCITSATKRESIDVHQPDGSVVKSAVFKHVMWRELF